MMMLLLLLMMMIAAKGLIRVGIDVIMTVELVVTTMATGC